MKIKGLFGEDKEPALKAKADTKTKPVVKAKADIKTKPMVKVKADTKTESAVKAEAKTKWSLKATSKRAKWRKRF